MTMIEKMARAINPLPYQSWESMYHFCIGQGDNEETAREYADKTHGPEILRTKEQATAALNAMREPTPEMAQAMKAVFLYGGHNPYSDISVSLAAAFISAIDAAIQEEG
ncbi:hypothetical protein WG907_05330 [Sphingobium sp. AN558]|uniref:hypothetical protein n=1 Tax=Sphingobium sp. AN558 TaxID=3133442 RepID=UPI0030C23076